MDGVAPKSDSILENPLSSLASLGIISRPASAAASAAPVSLSSTPIDISGFKSLGPIISIAELSHTVDKGHIPDSNDVWYRKEIDSPAKARSEWLAQEFLRLIIPNQVETRLAYNSATNVYYILSKEVPQFKPLPSGEKEQFANGTYKGLGHIVMGGYFVHEADLKNGNIGLGPDDTVYKIDGDWAFASMRDNEQFPKHSANISSYQIKKLPFPVVYRSYNWLDIVVEGVQYSESSIVTKDIASTPQFKAEKFETILKLLLIPKSYFTHFVDAFIPAGAAEYSEFLITRQHDLLVEAKKIPEFLEYLKEHQSQLHEMSNEFKLQMQYFAVNSTPCLCNDKEQKKFLNDAAEQFNKVWAALEIYPAARIKSLADSAETPSEDNSHELSASSSSYPASSFTAAREDSIYPEASESSASSSGTKVDLSIGRSLFSLFKESAPKKITEAVQEHTDKAPKISR